MIPKAPEKGRDGDAEGAALLVWVRFANSLGARCLSWQSTMDMHWFFCREGCGFSWARQLK
jgi:hypothetical protein